MNKELLAALIYHEGKVEVANVYGTLHQDAEMRAYWGEQCARHRIMAEAIRTAASVEVVKE